ncbi:helix-turn-helix domain-containing protein [Tsukamurella sp. 8F]|uniref:PucR family transcriptional regulator n=1 Tax=unclassified Tsukamurella TaxID=2633480 RepID=UPI0023B8BAFA|nr:MULTISPECIES: helix-turn-helix domain-containing protein [unclassified Tsukamurella]MDF0530400.1 helix-turn-helix domain-containing protein [Tsukamurella sp. 8J]MDF0587779.1 helix-turn-helix domain-containing protein [Tsukamurella sp. 8F]
MTSPRSASSSEKLAAIGTRLLARLDQLCADQAALIRDVLPVYRNRALIPDADLFQSCKAQAEFTLIAMGTGLPDTSPAYDVGRRRAEQGVPLADVMAAYRTGSRFWWDRIAAAVVDTDIARDGLLRAADEAWQNQALYTDAMTEGYTESATEMLMRDRHRREALVRALLDGRLPPEVTPVSAAESLGLPHDGPFVVASASGGPEPWIWERRMRTEGLATAWCADGDTSLGIVALCPGADVETVTRAFTRHTTGRVGVSPIYQSPLPGTDGLYYAGMALRATTSNDRVIAFDTSPYAVVAVSAPPVLHRYVEQVLGELLELSSPAQQVLLDTLEQWTAHAGSVPSTAQALRCHPNTIRYRLRRITDYTHRDIHRPRDLAELLLAVEAHRRLPQT